MAENKDEVLPPLEVPKDFTVKIDETLGYADRPLTVKIVKGMDWDSFLVNLFTMSVLTGMFYWLLQQKIINPRISLTASLVIIWIILVAVRHHLWVVVAAREADVYLDNIAKIIVIYFQGFHFTAWYYRKERDKVDFQRHEIISATMKEKTEIRFPSKDGYEMVAEITIMFNRRPEADALSRSLKFQIPELRKWILAGVAQKLSEIGGLNSYKVLLRNKSQVTHLISLVFEGQNRSQFEDDTGTLVRNPVLENLDLSPDSKEIFRSRAKIETMAENIKQLTGKDEVHLSDEEASFAAQAASGSLTRVVHTYQGIPKDAKVVALGDSGIALAGGGGGRNNRKGNKENRGKGNQENKGKES
jgi:hypothetical protein